MSKIVLESGYKTPEELMSAVIRAIGEEPTDEEKFNGKYIGGYIIIEVVNE